MGVTYGCMKQILGLLAFAAPIMTGLLVWEVMTPKIMVQYDNILPTPTPAPVWNVPDRPSCKRMISVGILDTGIDYNHNDLVQYVDDRVGVNYVDKTQLPFDDHGHGTHVAGLIVAQWKSQAATAVCLRLYALKYYEIGSYLNLSRSTEALNQAVGIGLDILNYSGGGLDESPPEKAAIERITRRGTIFVSAAGNDGLEARYYPAAYGIPGSVGVASTYRDKKALLPSSNYGVWFDFATIGLGLRSSLPNNHYGTMSGTSQATATISGMLAVLLAQDQGDTEGRRGRVLSKLRSLCQPLKGVSCGYIQPFAAP